MTRIKSIPVLQAAKVCGLTGLMLGGLSSCLGLVLVFIISTESPIVTLTVLISLPLVAALIGFAGTAVACWMYNAHAQWSGGLWLELQTDSVATRGAGETSETGGQSPGQGESLGGGQPTPLEQKSIKVYRMKLGRGGTGRLQKGSPSQGEAGEWVDLRNDGSASVRTGGLCFYHLEYAGPKGEPEYRFVATLPECWLKPGEILRVHSGPKRDLLSLDSEGRTGADRHAFTGGEPRIWNRREGDTAVLYALAAKEVTDSVYFDPNPPEDAVLWRQGSKLVPAPVSAGATRG